MLILASRSPRRRELLERITPWFQVLPADCDEALDCPAPAEHARLLALRKLTAAQAQAGPEDGIIAADTMVALEGALLGKPRSEREAVRMLTLLSGRTHQVYTGVAVAYGGETRSFVEETQVTFYPLTQAEIGRYVATGEPMDKAGAYGIQGRGALLVRSISGDYCNVVGLPIARLARVLAQLGVPLTKEARP